MRIALRGVGHRFGTAPFLFRQVHTVAGSGQLTALVGPSGSGKSTLLAIIAGWVAPTEGTVERPASGRVHWVFQNPLGVPRRTVLDHISLPLLAQGRTRRSADAAADALLRRFGLHDRRAHRYSALSGGEAQRLMLARATASAASVLLVDEPTAQLDPASAETVIGVLRGLADRGSVVVIATHDPRVTAQCDDVVDLGAAEPRGGS